MRKEEEVRRALSIMAELRAEFIEMLDTQDEDEQEQTQLDLVVQTKMLGVLYWVLGEELPLHPQEIQEEDSISFEEMLDRVEKVFDARG